MTNRGSALTEFLIGGGFLIVFLMGALPLLYFAFASVWCQWCLHEGVICLLEQNKRDFCELEVENRIAHVLPLGKLASVRLRTERFKAKGHLNFSVSPGLSFEKSITLTNHYLEDRLL